MAPAANRAPATIGPSGRATRSGASGAASPDGVAWFPPRRPARRAKTHPLPGGPSAAAVRCGSRLLLSGRRAAVAERAPLPRPGWQSAARACPDAGGCAGRPARGRSCPGRLRGRCRSWWMLLPPRTLRSSLREATLRARRSASHGSTTSTSSYPSRGLRPVRVGHRNPTKARIANFERIAGFLCIVPVVYRHGTYTRSTKHSSDRGEVPPRPHEARAAGTAIHSSRGAGGHGRLPSTPCSR